MTNADIAKHLLDYARTLAISAHLFRARAYRMAAFVIQGLDGPVEELLAEKGRNGLAELPGIGSHLAFTIDTLVTTGEFVPYSERKRWRMGQLGRVA
jgi:DNA polymerase/3'-5' exonuclease PolX